MAKWSKVKVGDRVQLGGREYDVTDLKPKGKNIRVTVRGAGGTFESKVAAGAKVKIVTTPAASSASSASSAPLHRKSGNALAQQGWATPAEAESRGPRGPRGLPSGDPAQTTPPKVAGSDLWDTPATKVEKRLDRLLGAMLVGEATDENAGYYVPPVDVTTVAGHLALFHGSDTSGMTESALIELHDIEHEQAAKGDHALKTNHWHTETRPETAA